MSDCEEIAESTHSLDSDFWDEMCREDELSLAEDDSIANERSTSGSKRPLERRCLVNCHTCGRPFKSMDGYKNHLKMHRLAELLQQMFVDDVIIYQCRQEFPVLLQCLAEEKEAGLPLTKEITSIAAHLLHLPVDGQCDFLNTIIEELIECFHRFSSISLSAFDASLKECVHSMLACTEKRSLFLNALKVTLPFEITDSSGHWIIADILRKLSTKVEAFILRTLREPYESKLFGGSSSDNTRDDPDDISFQQTVYYIGGSTVRSIMKLGLRSKNSATWKNVIECMKQKFLVGDLSSAPETEVISWTESANRGGLKFISEPFWCFLMALSGLLQKLEGRDGSLVHDSVLNAVKGDDILMVLWKEVLGDYLGDNDSEFLLTKVCHYFTNTWGAGVVLRRKNAIANQAMDKNPLRASLLTRK